MDKFIKTLRITRQCKAFTIISIACLAVTALFTFASVAEPEPAVSEDYYSSIFLPGMGLGLMLMFAPCLFFQLSTSKCFRSSPLSEYFFTKGLPLIFNGIAWIYALVNIGSRLISSLFGQNIDSIWDGFLVLGCCSVLFELLAALSIGYFAISMCFTGPIFILMNALSRRLFDCCSLGLGIPEYIEITVGIVFFAVAYLISSVIARQIYKNYRFLPMSVNLQAKR